MNVISSLNYMIDSQCNLDCKHCYVEKINTNIVENEIVSNFKLFIDKLIKENFVFNYLTFTGYEPTMLSGEKYREMLDYCYEQYNFDTFYFKNRFSIQTNGINLNGLLDYIGQEEITLNFSLDGYKEHHDELRESGSWNKTLKNIQLAKELDYNIVITCVLAKPMLFNFEKIQQFIYLCTTMGAKIIFKQFISINNDLKEKYSINNSDGFELGKLFLKNSFYKHVEGLTDKTCSFSGNQCYSLEFKGNGNTYTCNKGYEEHYCFADWKKETFKNILELRKNLFSDIYFDIRCLKCEYYDLCHCGCPINRIEGKSLNCEFFKGIFYEAKQFNAFSLKPLIRNTK